MNSCGCCANETPRATRRPHQWSDEEVEMEKTADEVKRLQSCINDLISVLALAAIWSGSESCQMLGTLLDSLLAILRLAIASFSLGLQDEVGVLVAGSRRADFPTQVELLLLRVAANQAAIGLQEARRSGEQKRVAGALERRVAERTSELTAVNEELRRSQAYLAEAQRLSHTGSFGWRVSTGEILWSDETFRIFQYDRTTKPTVELALQRVHPDDAALVRQTIERASRDGKDFDFEHRLLMADSSIKHVRVVGHAERDQSRELEFVGAVMDVTAAKDAEERIRQDERELRITIETIPAIVSCARPDGTVDFISHKWLDYIGRSREEIVGAWQSTIHPEDLDRVLNSWQAALA